jgi:hypothetical protein
VSARAQRAQNLQHIEARDGEFTFDSLTQVTLSDPADENLRAVAEFLAEVVLGLYPDGRVECQYHGFKRDELLRM